jgi:hypothetical protein
VAQRLPDLQIEPSSEPTTAEFDRAKHGVKPILCRGLPRLSPGQVDFSRDATIFAPIFTWVLKEFGVSVLKFLDLRVNEHE